MPGPLHAPTVLVLYPFRFRDPVTRKWVKARYVCDYPTLTRRYAEFEVIGPPEMRRRLGDSFNPWRRR